MADRNWWPKPARNVGNRWEYGSLTFWAEGGGVYVIDQDPRPDDPETQKSHTLPSWRKIIEMQKNYLLRAIEDAHLGGPQEIAKKAQHVKAIRSCVQAMEIVAAEAERQGDLTQASTQRYYREHIAPVKRTHLVPGLILP